MSRLWGTSLHENARFYIRSMEEQTYKYFTANCDRMKKKKWNKQILPLILSQQLFWVNTINYCEKSLVPLSLTRGVERQLLISVLNKLLSLFFNRTNCSFLCLGLDDKCVCIVIRIRTSQGQIACCRWNKLNWEEVGVQLYMCMCPLMCYGVCMLHIEVKDEREKCVCVCVWENVGSRWYDNSIVVKVVLPQHCDAAHTFTMIAWKILHIYLG